MSHWWIFQTLFHFHRNLVWIREAKGLKWISNAKAQKHSTRRKSYIPLGVGAFRHFVCFKNLPGRVGWTGKCWLRSTDPLIATNGPFNVGHTYVACQGKSIKLNGQATPLWLLWRLQGSSGSEEFSSCGTHPFRWPAGTRCPRVSRTSRSICWPAPRWGRGWVPMRTKIHCWHGPIPEMGWAGGGKTEAPPEKATERSSCILHIAGPQNARQAFSWASFAHSDKETNRYRYCYRSRYKYKHSRRGTQVDSSNRGCCCLQRSVLSQKCVIKVAAKPAASRDHDLHARPK